MEKEEFNTIVLMTARILGLQKEVNYLQMFGLQGEKAKMLDAFLKKIANLSRRNKGAIIANHFKEKPFTLSEKQAYCISKSAIKNHIEL
jgi:uncharacterized protein YydD (DUF2326 family)